MCVSRAVPGRSWGLTDDNRFRVERAARSGADLELVALKDSPCTKALRQFTPVLVPITQKPVGDLLTHER